MKMRMSWLAVLALGLATAQTARAADTDSLTVTITPNVNYAVSINTTAVVLDLGAVNLNTSTFTVKPVAVTVASSWASTDLTVQGAIDAVWSFDPATGGAEADSLAAWAVFTDTGASGVTDGVDGAFSGAAPAAANSDVLSAAVQDVGDGAQAGRFVKAVGSPSYRSMEDIPNNVSNPGAAQSHLFLKFRLPGSTSSSAARKVSVILTAGAPN